jgi:cbb3-type cytochrome oxidase maturation protein
MGIIVLLISISLCIAIGFLVSFLWNMKSGQYDDTYSPSVRMLFDDKMNNQKVKSDTNEKQSAPRSTTPKV